MQYPLASIFPLVIENLLEGIIYQNLSGEIVYANPAASKILGLTHEQLLGKTSFDNEWKAIKEDYSDFPGKEHPAMLVLRTGQIQSDIIMGVTTGTGKVSWLKINSHPVFDDNGKVKAAITSFADITREILSVENFKKLQQNHDAILSSIKEGFYLIDKNFRILLINKSAQQIHQKIFNKTFGTGDMILDIFPPGRLPLIKENFAKSFKGENVEYEVLYKVDNNDLWLHISYNPVYNPAGEVIYICVGIIDITKRKQAEAALIGYESRFRETLLHMGDNAWEHNFVTGVTTFSTGINELTAYVGEENINRQKVWLESIFEEDRWLLANLTADYVSGNISSHALEYRLKYKDGSIKWILDRGIVIEKDKAGKPVRAIGTRTDISERKKIEEDIKENERKFRAIFNSTYQYMGLMTVEGILLEANQTAIDFFRIPKEEIMGMNFVDSRWFSESTREKSKLALAKAARGIPVNYELELDLLDGRKVIIDFSIRPIFDALGNIILLIPEGRDITDKLKMERELEQQRENREKEILNAGIEGQEKQRREVARELHDNINQILATIKVYLQLAAENESLRKELIDKSYNNVSYAIEEVRKLSKALAPPTLDESSLTEELEQMVNDMVLSMLYEIDFRHDDFDEDMLDNAQKMTIYRIVQEQLTNILKYSKAKKIIITLSTASGEAVLNITDDGIGFDTGLRTSGTGIKNMMNRVETHSGRFNITSSPGKGCILQIKLPLTKSLHNERT